MDPEVADLLRSIDTTLKAILALARQRTERTQSKAVASDRDLDGKYGDPLVKFMPRDWTGPSFTGRHMSECPAPLLDLLAEAFDYFAKQSELKGDLTTNGKPVAEFKRLDAARARGWAARARASAQGPAEGPRQTQADKWGQEEQEDWQ